eukprot:TRINITY_DN37272_c0_g1_i1.p1 TRINITY_DN37272_c0_g1~~TRINITY_DN37272_c0_g1_i1.p1  ORF type:complete len:135 (-),score=12.02 TRINITY_DN37272_c0_g1_i1:8-361(-)
MRRALALLLAAEAGRVLASRTEQRLCGANVISPLDRSLCSDLCSQQNCVYFTSCSRDPSRFTFWRGKSYCKLAWYDPKYYHCGPQIFQCLSGYYYPRGNVSIFYLVNRTRDSYGHSQ